MADNQENYFQVIEKNIRELASAKGITLSELITEIEMTEGGFYRMLQTDSMKVKTLKKIADVLEKPIQMFFEGSNNTIQTVKGNKNTTQAHIHYVSEPEAEYKVLSLENQVEQLKSQLADKQHIIDLLSKK